jgi:hypothetical protein
MKMDLENMNMKSRTLNFHVANLYARVSGSAAAPVVLVPPFALESPINPDG